MMIASTAVKGIKCFVVSQPSICREKDIWSPLLWPASQFEMVHGSQFCLSSGFHYRLHRGDILRRKDDSFGGVYVFLEHAGLEDLHCFAMSALVRELLGKQSDLPLCINHI